MNLLSQQTPGIAAQELFGQKPTFQTPSARRFNSKPDP